MGPTAIVLGPVCRDAGAVRRHHSLRARAVEARVEDTASASTSRNVCGCSRGRRVHVREVESCWTPDSAEERPVSWDEKAKISLT